MNSNLTVSIVIPIYNEETYIRECLEAIKRQTVRPFEVIVVDNNSTDGSMEIARSFPFVKIIKEETQGRVYAQNTGFRAAKGTIIGRIDADARLEPQWTEKVIGYFNKNPETAALTGKGYFYNIPSGRLAGNFQVFVYQYVQKVITGTFILWGANMAVRKDAWLAVEKSLLIAGDKIDEDIDLSLKLAGRGYYVGYDSNLLVGASLRRDEFDPISMTKYLSTWPRDFFMNKLYIQGIFITIITILSCIFSVPLWIARKLMRVRG